MKPQRVYGVDFSGAKDAGRKIWIAGGEIDGDVLHFDICKPAASLPGSGRHRELALAALRVFIGEQAPCVVGLDFPFGLPRDLVREDRWEDFARTFGAQYHDAEAFKSACWDAAGGQELRRDTDNNAGTPFSPYNLRLYRQTYYGIRDVLAKLVRSGSVSVLPMQIAVSGRSWLIEICPASTLKQMGLYQTYKDAKSAPVREAILASLRQSICIDVPESVRAEILNDKHGDALDSVIAAVATFRAHHGSIECTVEGSRSAIEGSVFV